MAIATEEQIMERLETVEDPELRESIVDLGLVYGVDNRDGDVTVTMTLTSPGCPLGGMIEGAVQDVLSTLEGVKSSKVNIVWTPRWDPRIHASEDIKIKYNLW
jgi:metal-sulfur cluster biosynthetic enzyme